MLRWWKSAVNYSVLLPLAAFRMRSSACDTLSQSCAWHVLCWFAFPSVPALGSTGSAADNPAPDCSAAGCSDLFACFSATMADPTSHARASSATAPRLPDADRCRCSRSRVRPPGSRARSVRTCQVLRPRRAYEHSRCVSVRVAFRLDHAVGTRERFFRGSMAGLCAPLPMLRCCPRGPQRTARGRCGSLLLHRSGLAPPTPCRSPGARPIPTGWRSLR